MRKLYYVFLALTILCFRAYKITKNNEISRSQNNVMECKET